MDLAVMSSELLADAEAVVSSVFLSPEAARPPFGLAPPDFIVASRVAPLGAMSPQVAASVLGLIEPRLAAGAAKRGAAGAAPHELIEARTALAETVLHRHAAGWDGADADAVAVELGRAADELDSAGHPLFAAVRALPPPATALGRLWRVCDAIREHRGAAHVNAFRAAGLDGAEICVLTELWRGALPGQSPVAVAWTGARQQEALGRLRQAGLVDADGVTAAGAACREAIERATDAQQQPLLRALRERYPDVRGTLRPLAAAVRTALSPPYWWQTWLPAASAGSPR